MQSEAASLPAAEYFPGAQSRHALSVFDPIPVEYFPLAQFTQRLAPRVAEYLPATHFAHTLTPEDSEYVPATQSTQTFSAKAL